MIRHLGHMRAMASVVALFAAFHTNVRGAMVPTPAVAPSSSRMVAALNSVFGAHPHYRANHARGLLVQATFTPSPGAEAVSRAPHFTGAASPVLVRFSNFGGMPGIGDADPGAAPYGMSLKFTLADGGHTDLVMHSYNGFPSATAAEFVEFLMAMGQSPAGKPSPTALERYTLLHPRAQAFLAADKPAPTSYDTQPYFGVNTFKFTNAAGEVSYGRYRMEPAGKADFLDRRLATKAGPDYLHAALRSRLASGPLLMRLQLQIAQSGDKLDDPSIVWPADRRVVDLGILSMQTLLDRAERTEQAVVFMPDELPDGIEAQDPMIAARTRAYAESLERRMR